MEDVNLLIHNAGCRALTSLFQEFEKHPVALTALDDEWNEFERYLSTFDPQQLALIEPLPARRVLREPESKELRRALAEQWAARGYWYPLSPLAPGMNVIAFHPDLWAERGGSEILLRVLKERGIERCFALLEGPTDYELDRALINPTYLSDETFLTSNFEWLLYRSHESSITVAGWLAEVFRSNWRDWAKITYEGPFRTANMRGTWRS